MSGQLPNPAVMPNATLDGVIVSKGEVILTLSVPIGDGEHQKVALPLTPWQRGLLVQRLSACRTDTP
jgi:hypothetical protein